MKSISLRRAGGVAAIAALSFAGFAYAQPGATAPPAGAAPAGSAPAAGGFKTFEEKLSYAMGVNIGRSLKKDGLNPDPRLFARGLQDAMGEGKPLLTDEEIGAVFEEVQKQMQEKAMAAQKKAAGEFQAGFDASKKQGEAQSTKSGLKYEVYEMGKGPKPKATDVVSVHYIGTLPGGKVFDSSVARGEPAEFPLNAVIPGWTEGLQLMPVGSKFKFFIPAALAYGERGAPPAIPANQDLVFDVQLLGIGDAAGE